jgi:hypothetical protein
MFLVFFSIRIRVTGLVIFVEKCSVKYCHSKNQYCESGSGIRCLFDPWIRDPGWVKSQDPDPGSGSGMNNPDHFSYILETVFFGLKYLNSLMWIRNLGWKKFGSVIRDGKIRIRDKHPESTTLAKMLIKGTWQRGGFSGAFA